MDDEQVVLFSYTSTCCLPKYSMDLGEIPYVQEGSKITAE
jgi:hypothetical protein